MNISLWAIRVFFSNYADLKQLSDWWMTFRNISIMVIYHIYLTSAYICFVVITSKGIVSAIAAGSCQVLFRFLFVLYFVTQMPTQQRVWTERSTFLLWHNDAICRYRSVSFILVMFSIKPLPKLRFIDYFMLIHRRNKLPSDLNKNILISIKYI